ncbi:leucine-rich repeat domain-containing protein [Schlesneria sp. T3-172]|uniref:leucine-rich repeat domain-containing protein n=1 Tax=Schlesneria sphaerica TaxID=3373610 RepID=UPI0037CB8174
MLERIAAVSIIIGTILGSVGFFWFTARAIRNFFRGSGPKSLYPPIRLILLSILLTALPIVVNSMMIRFVGHGPHDKNVSGERHLTLTGWDRDDYSIIGSSNDLVVLQMANPDVTDETLKYLTGQTQLRELDLNNTQITDEGLKILAELPALRDLRLARTKITDAGFREHLLGKESLLNLELTGTSVASKTLREWKAENSERKYLK